MTGVAASCQPAPAAGDEDREVPPRFANPRVVRMTNASAASISALQVRRLPWRNCRPRFWRSRGGRDDSNQDRGGSPGGGGSGGAPTGVQAGREAQVRGGSAALVRSGVGGRPQPPGSTGRGAPGPARPGSRGASGRLRSFPSGAGQVGTDRSPSSSAILARSPGYARPRSGSWRAVAERPMARGGLMRGPIPP
jgi:hypothetical protein